MTVLNLTISLSHTGAVMECLPNCNVQLVAAMGVVFFLGVTLIISIAQLLRAKQQLARLQPSQEPESHILPEELA